MPLRLRIAIFDGGVVLLTVLLFSLLLYGLAAGGLTNQQNQALAGRAAQTVAYLQQAPAVDLRSQRALVPIDLGNGNDIFVELLDAAGTPTWSSGEIAGRVPAIPSALLATAAANGHAVATLPPQQGVRLRVYLQRWSRTDQGVAGYALAGQPLRSTKQQLSGLRTFLILTALLCLAAAVAANWLALGRALRPLRAMARAVEEIGQTQDLARRLPEVHTSDEIGLLTRSFNSMLGRVQQAQDRLAAALDAQKRFVADASHELRTPLTTIRNNAGFLLQRPDATAEDRLAALQDIAGEGDRMSRLVQDLLTLARADAGYRLDLSPTDLRPLLHDVARKAQQLHPDRRIQVEAEAAMVVLGNADALTQLLWIMIDNAARHTGQDGQILLKLACSRGAARLSVCDDGRGILASERERIFERFYQSDSARSSGAAGLGLAIGAWIATQHHARLTAANNATAGATFTLEIPPPDPA